MDLVMSETHKILGEVYGLPLICTILGLIVGVLGYFYGPYWGVRKVPGPPAIPFVGHLPLLAKYGPDLFSVLAQRYGPIYRLVLLLLFSLILNFILIIINTLLLQINLLIEAKIWPISTCLTLWERRVQS